MSNLDRALRLACEAFAVEAPTCPLRSKVGCRGECGSPRCIEKLVEHFKEEAEKDG